MASEVDWLHSRAEFLAARFQRGGESSCIEEAIVLDRKALERRPPGHPERSVSLTWLSVHLCARHTRHGTTEDVDEAIVLCREALDLTPPSHPDRSTSLNNLAGYLSNRYDRSGATGDLDDAIVICREVLSLTPPGHPEWTISLNNLAIYLLTRYNRNGAAKDLDDAIILCREALDLRPPGHPDRSNSLNNLAGSLSNRYNRNGAAKDLDNAIALCREALDLMPPGHPNRSFSLDNLASNLSDRYARNGGIEDLDDAIVLCREALDLRPPSHPNRSISLSNLATYLTTRYDRNRGTEDLDDAIVLCREALDLMPLSHPDRSVPLNNLAIYFSTRYKRNGRARDLDDAIVLCREALNLRPHGHPNRSFPLNNLTVYLTTRYDQNGGTEDLDDAIVLCREALDLMPPGRPHRSFPLNNLASYLSKRYDRNRGAEDLDDAIVLCREALSLTPPGHPLRSTSLENLASYLSNLFRQSRRFEDKDEAFSLYAQLADATQFVSSADLSAAKSWITAAEHFQHSSLLLAYQTSLRLLVQHIATLPSLPQHLPILKNLASSLAVDAFSACLSHRSSAKAVELLEQGRGVFWSQLTRLRSPLEDVVASGPAGSSLADGFSRLASLIRDALDSPMADQHEQVYRLNAEMEKIVARIRELPGLSRFLLPSLFSDLQQAAKEGPVIVVNASRHSCDALVIFLDRDPVHIPLQITQTRVRELATELASLTRYATKVDMTKQLAFFLRKLWDQIVSPIVDFLQTTLPSQSRIWWCPTAEFSLLPLHAAGPYRTGQQKLADMYISSYTPTLTALIRARRRNPPKFPAQRKCISVFATLFRALRLNTSNSTAEGKRFLVIGQANAAGEGKLLSVGAELDDIGKRVNHLATFTRIDGEESCIARVVEELGRNEWVHLACHGIPNPTQPFESAFALHDGRFTIRRIIGCELKNPEFAYLSACHTTVGHEESPDEVIHLAAAMQFLGFRSVIGTMWAVDDGETKKITSTFYRYMVDESGRLDHTRAAYALNRTMRLVHIPLDQRILYVHLGA